MIEYTINFMRSYKITSWGYHFLSTWVTGIFVKNGNFAIQTQDIHYKNSLKNIMHFAPCTFTSWLKDGILDKYIFYGLFSDASCPKRGLNLLPLSSFDDWDGNKYWSN